jgi:hypothetical protein
MPFGYSRKRNELMSVNAINEQTLRTLKQRASGVFLQRTIGEVSIKRFRKLKSR